MSKGTGRVLRTAMIIILALALAGGSALATSIAVRINEKTKVYKSASTSARSVTVSKGMEVTLTGYNTRWGRIVNRGVTGYIPIKYVDRVSPLKAWIKADATAYAKAGSGRLGTLKKGTVVYMIGLDGSYSRVQNAARSATAYVKTSALSSKKVDGGSGGGGSTSADVVPERLRSTTTSVGGSKIEYTIYLAQNQMGKPYSTSANPPESFDCARLVYYCYGGAKRGSVRGSAKSQGYDARYAQIAYENLKRGDMVCFDTVSDSDLSDHVGVYLGEGYFIHASSSAKKVIVSNLDSGYYRRTFSWGRRVFGS